MTTNTAAQPFEESTGRRVRRLLRDQPDLCQPDMEVLYDPVTNFVLESIKTTSNGDELLIGHRLDGDRTRCDEQR